ncbi:TIGR02922 family protein [Shewanella sp. SG44-6]|nr:TIGR02922 family protein [Shewanella sp. SG44-6]
MMAEQTITVIYYTKELSISPLAEVLFDMPVSSSGRVIIPKEFKEDKIIVAVLKGEVEMLNSLGERFELKNKNVA